MEELQREVLEDLTAELESTEGFNKKILEVKVKNAFREVLQKRNYQKRHSEDFIREDFRHFYSNIRNLALYDYNMEGAEFHKSYSENGTSRNFEEREKCFAGVIPYASIL